MHKPAQPVEILLHVLRIHDQLVDDAGEAVEREIERDGRIRPDHALDRGMRDVAFVPERHILHRGQRIGAHHAGQAGDIFRQHRIALVRHRRRALLALREEFFRFQHLGALQMADFGREPLDRGGDHAQRREIHRVPVARDHLGRDRLDREPHGLGDMRLYPRVDLREGADRAGNGAGRDLLAGGDQPRLGPVELGIGLRELQPERGRLGMDAVRAADGRRQLVFEGAALQRGQQLVGIGDQDVGGARKLNVQAGVEHVGGGHALMHETRLGSDDLGQMGQEGDDVVLDLGLDRVDPRHVEGGGTCPCRG